MPQLLHSIAVQDQSIAADGIVDFDLAVNPLSVVLLCIRPLNETSTLANFQTYKGLCSAFNRISVLFRGESVVSIRGEDLAAMNYLRHGIMPWQGYHKDVDNDRRCAVLPILLGKHAYDPTSCFPPTRRGELVLELDIDVADTGYDNFRLSVETIELLGAKPSEYEKKVQITQTFAATGDVDVDLPPGNVNRGILAFGTTPMTGATPAPSWGRMKVLLDNVEAGYAATDWEVAQMLTSLWGRQPPAYDGHGHRVDATGGATQATLSGPFAIGHGIAGATDINGWNQYAFLDFDPTRDDTFSLDTRGKSRFHLRANAETADAIRVVPCEVIKMGGSLSPTQA
jgi:hypothetical protein